MSTQDVAVIVGRRVYKPGWVLGVYEGDLDGPHVVIAARVEDSYRPGETAPLDVHAVVPDAALESELAFDKWLVWRLGQVEIHECREWYRRTDAGPASDRVRPVFNPHRDGADRDRWPVVKREPLQVWPEYEAG